jgi:hypothetical protein
MNHPPGVVVPRFPTKPGPKHLTKRNPEYRLGGVHAADSQRGTQSYGRAPPGYGALHDRRLIYAQRPRLGCAMLEQGSAPNSTFHRPETPMMADPSHPDRRLCRLSADGTWWPPQPQRG